MDDVAGGAVVVPVGLLVRDAVDEMMTVVFEPPSPLSSLPVDVGGVEEGGSSAVVVGSSGVVVGGASSDVVVGGGSSLVVVGGGASEVVGGSVGSSVGDAVVGGGGSEDDVTGGGDVSAVEVGCSISDVGVGVPGSVGSILVLLEDMVKRRSKVSRRRGGLYMVTLAPASDGEVCKKRKASLTFS